MTSCLTSESVTAGHPDKVCDRIADRILDAVLAQDPRARVACEVAAVTNQVHIMGEITTTAAVDYVGLARQAITDCGYTEPGQGFDAESCAISVEIHEQSPDIAMGICRSEPLDSGAGDQGMMFGYACNETAAYMPLPIELAHRLTKRLEAVRRSGELPYLLPDGKAQVTVQYEDDRPTRVSTVVLSTQHRQGVSMDRLREEVAERVIRTAIPERWLDEDTAFFVNPTGRFVIGGPAGDTGLTGRKLIVDTYGGMARNGGGSFSGKDPTKVDRSGAYMARYIAKNLVAAGLADRCEIQISYAIGLADPLAVRLDCFGTEKQPLETLMALVERDVDLRPAAIIERLQLRRPLYEKVCCYGHFGENAARMPWEQMDLSKQWQIGRFSQ